MGNSRMNSHLTKKQLKSLMDLVQAERDRIFNKLNLESSGQTFIKDKSGDEVDSANDDIMRKTELRFATREMLYLKKLNKTIRLMDTDEYGMCDECGAQISFTRLSARPTSTMCITCKEESERDELQNYQGRMSKSLSTMNMK